MPVRKKRKSRAKETALKRSDLSVDHEDYNIRPHARGGVVLTIRCTRGRTSRTDPTSHRLASMLGGQLMKGFRRQYRMPEITAKRFIILYEEGRIGYAPR